MIAALSGTLAERNLDHAVIDVQGVGYRVHLSLLALSRLPEEGQRVHLRIRTVVREDALDLYGFLSRQEEELFELLTSVSHVGPKMGLSVLSGLEVEALIQALAAGEVGRLTKIHGVGKKTAERLVLELREKAKKLGVVPASAGKAPAPAPSRSPARDDLVSALVNLGYKPAQAEKAADGALERAGAEAPFEALFREAMKALRAG